MKLPLPGICAGVLGLAFLLAADEGSAQTGRNDGLLLPASDSGASTAIVARVGPISITARQFLLSYEFGPAFVKRRRDSKRKHLDFMINEKLLALNAAERGSRRSAAVQRSAAEIEGDLATEELYRRDILDSVRITEGEIREAMAAQRVHDSLQWIFAPTREEIRRMREKIDAGTPFDTLFRQQIGDSADPGLRSWETTRFQLRTLRPEIASVAETLAVRAASAPLEGPDGWYIVRLQNVTFDVVTNDAEAARERSDAQSGLTQRKADSLSDRYINRLMSAESPVIERKTFGLLSVALAQLWVPPDRRAAWDLAKDLDREAATAAMANIDRFEKEPLVRLRSRTVRLENFLAWYRDRDRILKLRTTSPLAFQLSLQGLVWRMVRDGLLIERAMRRKLNASQEVRTQKIWWEEKILYAQARKQMADSIMGDTRSLMRYYDAHRREFVSQTGDTLSFAAARGDVEREYRAAELTKLLLHRLLALRKKYPVEVYDHVLNGLPVDDENNPKAIDVYIAKTRGTFPHPAFPTIDEEWQTWE